MQSPVFVSAIYGEDYLPFITSHLYSVWRAHPGSRHVVLWQDLPFHEMELLRSAFPDAVFTPIEDSIEGNSDQKIPRRLHAWRQACEEYRDHPICFLDCDLLVLRPLDQFIPTEVDVVFTWKDEMFPLNAGVILIRAGESGRAFLDEWTELTEALVSDPAKMKRFRKASGGGSQHTFREIAGWVNYDRVFTRSVRGHDVIFQGVPCAQLNETRCVPVTENTHIVHYKSGWHSLLLGKTGYTRTRPEKKCAEMYALWLRIEKEACRHVAACLLERVGQELPGDPGANGIEALRERIGSILGAGRFITLGVGSTAERLPDSVERVELSEAWIEEVATAYREKKQRRLRSAPRTLRRNRQSGEESGELIRLEASLGDALPAILAWVLTCNPLPHAVIVESPGEADPGLRSIEEHYLRLAPLPSIGDAPEGYVLIPQAKESRKLASDFPAFAPDPAGAGWLGRVSQLVQRAEPRE